MAKKVVPFAFTPGRPDLMQGVEVFVRAHLTGSTTWSGDTADRVHEVVFRPTFLDAEVPRRGVVDRRDIVAMVHDDRADRYAFADAHVEPIGEPRFTLAYFGIPLLCGVAWWVVDATGPAPRIMSGPFDAKHLAQAEADDLNQEDAAR